MKEKREARSAQVDSCKLEELKRLARQTECLAMEIACELQDPKTDGSGHPRPPTLASISKSEDGSVDGSGHPDPPTLDAIVDIAYGARKIREGVCSLT